MDRISQIKKAILELISEQKCLYEDNYHDLCYDLDAKEASAINDWIIQSYIPIKKNDVGRKYKRKVKNIVQHPSLSNQQKIKSALGSAVEGLDKLAGAFEEEVSHVEDMIRRKKEDEPKRDWSQVDKLLADAKRSYSVSKLRNIWNFLGDLKPTFASKFNTDVSFNTVTFKSCIAFSAMEKAKGLEILSSLEDSQGMLFPFEESNHVTFHMGSVSFPIDILFLTDTALGLKVAKIVHNALPGTTDIWSCGNTSHVLEVPGGSCKKYDIKLNDLCFIM